MQLCDMPSAGNHSFKTKQNITTGGSNAYATQVCIQDTNSGTENSATTKMTSLWPRVNLNIRVTSYQGSEEVKVAESHKR